MTDTRRLLVMRCFAARLRFLLRVGCVLLSALPLCSGWALQVSDFTYSHIGRAEGMGSQRIFSICQSSSGAIWWSSMTGIGRYNGSMVRNYSLDDNTPYGHLGGRVIHIVADSSRIIAFDNRGSIYQFSDIRDGFVPLTSLAAKLGHEVALNDICLSGSRMYLAMHDGMYVLNDTTLTRQVKDIYVNRIVTVAGRRLLCAREGVLDDRGRRLLPYNAESAYYDELSGKLWVGGYENGLHLVSLGSDGGVKSDAFVRLPSSASADLHGENPIRSICPYDDETMLIGVDGEGVCQMRRDGMGACSLLFDANDTAHGVLHGNGVYSILVDSWRNIVVGTYSGGIDIARPTGSTAAVYRHVANNHQSLLNDHVNMVMPLSDELLLMGTDNGISILNTQTGVWKHCCQGTVVLSASKKPDGSVLVSTYGKGVYEIDAQANVRHVHTTANSALKDDHVYATLYDRDNHLWVGCLNGDLLYKTTMGCQYYPVHDVQAITQLASGQIAVGTAFGLKFITPGSSNIKDLNYAPSGHTDVNPFVTHLLASGLELWIATDGGGVYVYHLAKHESRQLTTANGLPSNYVRSLLKSRDGRIWIATDEGLSFVAPGETDQVVNANYCYGLNCEYSRGAAQMLSNGDLVFGTSAGAIVVHPENVQSINYTAKLVFVGVECSVDQERLLNEQVSRLLRKGELRLDYRQRTFNLLFESVNMRNHFDIAYRYRVGKGEWSQPTDQQYIRFVNMEPGRHQLTLQCISSTNGTVIDSRTLTIAIAQPWWNAWWMWCVYVSLVLLAFYGAWRVYELHEKYMRLTIVKASPCSSEVKASPSPSEGGDVQIHDTSVLTNQTSPPLEGLGEALESLGEVLSEEPEEASTGKDFVDKATQLIIDNLSDSEFTIDRLCREMAMSRTLFYVKLKSYTGKSPQDFIRIIRLERAAALLHSGRSVADAAALTGFDNPKYFSTVFKKYFDVSPSKYQ